MSPSAQKLRAYLQAVPPAIRRVPARELSSPVAPGKWSKQEIFGHLCDSALHNLSRFTHAAQEKKIYTFSTYQQNVLVESNAYQEQPLAEIIMLWQSLNQQILRVWEKMPHDQWGLKISNPDQNLKNNLAFLAEDYVRHMEHHLLQIFKNLETILTPEDQLTLSLAERALAHQTNQRFITLIKHGNMSVELYHPLNKDLQQPHRQDELYVVISGESIFYRGGKRTRCTAGDVLFVPAGIVHRFEQFSDDFKVWVIFYGPDGGEQTYPVFEKEMVRNSDSYLVSTENGKLDHQTIFNFLQGTYWAKGRTTELFRRSLSHSLNFGLYRNKEQQIGFARIVTDFTTVAYLADVFILEDFQRKGLGKYLMECLVAHPALVGIPKMLLHTRDAHSLYEEIGFKRNPRGELWMERLTMS